MTQPTLIPSTLKLRRTGQAASGVYPERKRSKSKGRAGLGIKSSLSK